MYDREDRIIMTTDTKLKADGKWSFIKYDLTGRVIYTGICTGGERSAEQSAADNSGVVYESRTTSPGFVNSSIQIYYTKNSYPTTITDVLSVNYYDQYPTDMPTAKPENIYAQPTLSGTITNNHSTKSLLTASLVRNVENNSWNKSYFWYDTKERLTGSYKANHTGGYTQSEMKLDFPGNITESKVTHRRNSSNPEVVVKQRYVYSMQNLLMKHYHKVDNHPEELLAQFTYDDLGRVTNKKVGNNLQSIDYSYNFRGWLTSVNNPANLGNDLFGFKINYNHREGAETPNNNYSGLKVKPMYNGSIAETSWATATSGIERYGYVYDGAGRMLAGLYQSPSNPYEKSHSEILTYDNRGNIKTIYRTSYKPLNGNVRLIDDLVYAYDGNRITAIEDLSANSNGYEGGGGAVSYDVNGNMTAMADKNISSINYNFLNLPTSIVRQNTTAFLYSADGTKLKKTLTLNNGQQSVNIVTEYSDGFQYSTPNSDLINGLLREPGNPLTEDLRTASEPEAYTLADKGIGDGNDPLFMIDLVFFPTAEGFYDYENSRYIYQYKDHLGNVRLSYTKNTNGTPKVLDINKYYPLGMNHLSNTPSVFDPLAVPYNYKYNGKELQETGLYDYGWRQYMPDIGR
ncbi:MAG: RHS repeat-associated core domain-containing protein, partial [Weeksellaceae bacterium]